MHRIPSTWSECVQAGSPPTKQSQYPDPNFTATLREIEQEVYEWLYVVAQSVRSDHVVGDRSSLHESWAQWCERWPCLRWTDIHSKYLTSVAHQVQTTITSTEPVSSSSSSFNPASLAPLSSVMYPYNRTQTGPSPLKVASLIKTELHPWRNPLSVLWWQFVTALMALPVCKKGKSHGLLTSSFQLWLHSTLCVITSHFASDPLSRWHDAHDLLSRNAQQDVYAIGDTSETGIVRMSPGLAQVNYNVAKKPWEAGSIAAWEVFYTSLPPPPHYHIEEPHNQPKETDDASCHTCPSIPEKHVVLAFPMEHILSSTTDVHRSDSICHQCSGDSYRNDKSAWMKSAFQFRQRYRHLFTSRFLSSRCATGVYAYKGWCIVDTRWEGAVQALFTMWGADVLCRMAEDVIHSRTGIFIHLSRDTRAVQQMKPFVEIIHSVLQGMSEYYGGAADAAGSSITLAQKANQAVLAAWKKMGIKTPDQLFSLPNKAEWLPPCTMTLLERNRRGQHLKHTERFWLLNFIHQLGMTSSLQERSNMRDSIMERLVTVAKRTASTSQDAIRRERELRQIGVSLEKGKAYGCSCRGAAIKQICPMLANAAIQDIEDLGKWYSVNDAELSSAKQQIASGNGMLVCASIGKIDPSKLSPVAYYYARLEYLQTHPFRATPSNTDVPLTIGTSIDPATHAPSIAPTASMSNVSVKRAVPVPFMRFSSHSASNPYPKPRRLVISMGIEGCVSAPPEPLKSTHSYLDVFDEEKDTPDRIDPVAGRALRPDPTEASMYDGVSAVRESRYLDAFDDEGDFWMQDDVWRTATEKERADTTPMELS
jgi:hypothetical protein